MDYTFPPKARFVQLHHSYDFAALGSAWTSPAIVVKDTSIGNKRRGAIVRMQRYNFSFKNMKQNERKYAKIDILRFSMKNFCFYRIISQVMEVD